MKKYMLILFGVILTLNMCILTGFAAEIDVWDGTFASEFSAGTGVENDPYLITSPEEFCYMLIRSSSNQADCYYRLENDIYLNDPSNFIKSNGAITGIREGAELHPWTYGRKFFGILDGNGQSVYGLYINSGRYPLIHQLSENSVIKNLHFKDVYAISGNLISAIVGSNYGIISETTFDGYMQSSMYGGGLACYNYAPGRIIDCFSTGEIVSEYAAGICVFNGAQIINCHNNATIVGESYTGGIVAENTPGGVITKCNNSGAISTTGNFVGGVCGFNRGTIGGSFNQGTIQGFAYGLPGGICGAMDGDTAYTVGCWNNGAISGEQETGGICAQMYEDSNMAYCYNYGICTSTAQNSVGGVVGEKYSGATITACCYDSGIIVASNWLGTASTTEDMQSAEYIAAYNAYVDTSPLNGLLYWVADSKNANNGYPIFAECNEVYHVSTNVTGRGLVQPQMDIEVLLNRSKTLYLAPDYGYQVESIEINGTLTNPTEEIHTPENSTGNVTIEITFSSDGTIAGSFAGGTGTEQDPYQITTMAEFAYLAQYVNDGGETEEIYYLLMNDIVFNPVDFFSTDEDSNITGVAVGKNPREWIPIGIDSKKFCGIFDGGNHTISGLYIASDKEGTGLFGSAHWQTGIIKNLTVNNGYVTSTMNDVGAIVGEAGKLLENCHNQNVTVIGTYGYTGGIAGGSSSEISGCTNSGTIIGNTVGGIVGWGNVIDGCVNTGDISAEYHIAGGIAGEANVIINCISSGNIATATDEAGGIAGRVSNTHILNCISTATISGTGGGIFGHSAGDAVVANCYFTGKPAVGSETHVAGIGQYDSKWNYTYDIQNCFYTDASLSDEFGKHVTVANMGRSDMLNALNLYCYDQTDYILRYWEQGETGLPVFSEADALYLVTVIAPIGGSLNISGRFFLLEGSNLTIIATPDNNHQVHSVLINGVNVGNSETHTISSVDKDCKIEVLFSDSAGTLLSGYSSGSGTKDDPYRIVTVKEFYTLSQLVGSGRGYQGTYFELGNDLELNLSNQFAIGPEIVTTVIGSALEKWTPIGNERSPFYGSFNGNNHTISGLYVNGEFSYAGLFGVLDETAIVQNLNLDYGCIITSGNYAGAIAGYSAGMIENCQNVATSINAAAGVGGIVGHNIGYIKECKNMAHMQCSPAVEAAGIVHWDLGKVLRCSNSGNIEGRSASGICSFLQGGTIEYCTNTANMLSNSTSFYNYAAGICARSRATSENIAGCITDCQNFGELHTKSENSGTAAGVSGDAYDVQISRCINYGNIFAGDSAAGIAGVISESYGLSAWCADCVNYGDIFSNCNAAGIVESVYAHCRNSVNHGDVTGGSGGPNSYVSDSSMYVGGVAGMQSGDDYVYNCGNTGSITGTKNVGGIIGRMCSGVFNCYNTGTVTGAGNVGGLAGSFLDYNSEMLYNCYTAGKVICEDATTSGALVGITEAFCIVSDCWYNSDLCDKVLVGTANGSIENCGEKTTTELSSNHFLALLNQGKYYPFAFKPWYVDPVLNLPVHGEFKASNPGDSVYVSVEQELEDSDICLKISITGDFDDACYISAYDKTGQMKVIYRIDCTSKSANVFIDSKHTWKIFALKHATPIISALSSHSIVTVKANGV